MNQDTKRETWKSKFDFLMTVHGFSVGVGAFYRFPYLCMRNGGGAFLIPYIIFIAIGAMPGIFLELTIGQFSQKGPVTVWNVCPSFKGIGVGTVLVSLFYSNYYIVLLAWVLYYLYFSFSSPLPWANCDNVWNTPACVTFDTIYGNSSYLYNATNNGTAIKMTAAEEFWRYKVLDISTGIENLGDLRGPLVGCLALAYIIVFLFMFMGIRVSGKVVYVTVTVPYIVLTAMFIRGCLLPGSGDGIFYFLYPDFKKLLDPTIWIDACKLALISLGTAMGCFITMAGHNKFTNNCFRDSVIAAVTDVFSNIYIGFAFFSVMGHVAYVRGLTVEAFESSGFNLGFIVYPEVISSLPLPQMWAALIFVLVFTLGIDSLIPCFEANVTAIMDHFPHIADRHWLVTILVFLPSFLTGLAYVTQGGMYVFTLVDWYAFFPSVALHGTLECIVIAWIYGTQRLNRDILMMWGKVPSRFMNMCMRYICPMLLMIVFSYSIYSYRPPNYAGYTYPTWAMVIGWMISLASIIPLPVIFVWTVYTSEGGSLLEGSRADSAPSLGESRDERAESENQEFIETQQSLETDCRKRYRQCPATDF